MDIEVIYRQFDKLEKKIEQLIEICESLKNEKTELQSKIDELEQELKRRIEANSHQTNQREMIQKKIDNLLTKLNDFSELS